MRRVFADTLYWLAIFLPGDEWTAAARAADLNDAALVTTEEVLSEFLTAVSAHGDHIRRLACRLVREILNEASIEVVVQSTSPSSWGWRCTRGAPTSPIAQPTTLPGEESGDCIPHPNQ